MGCHHQGTHHQAGLLAVSVSAVLSAANVNEWRASIDRFELLGWSCAGSQLTVRCRLGPLDFCEVIDLGIGVDEVPSPELSRLFDVIAAAVGISYYKAAAPEIIDLGPLTIDDAGIALLRGLYDDGLREFAVHNGQHVPRHVTFVGGHRVASPGVASPDVVTTRHVGRPLMPFGAGRDSTLLAWLLSDLHPVLVTVQDNIYARRTATALGDELMVISRPLDPLLLELNSRGALNGHIPVTAINSLVCAAVAVLCGCDVVVMANERSASEPTRFVNGVAVNHQWSKSLDCEVLIDAALTGCGVSVTYTSALRPWGELSIARAFARADVALHRSFMSCNQAFLRDDTRRSNGWCRQCPKCRSVFLSLAPFTTPVELVDMFGANLLDDPTQFDGFGALMSLHAKPFECVGEVRESRSALAMLANDPLWRGAVVVAALAPSLMIDDYNTELFDRSDAHHVPLELLVRLSPALDATS
jgi:UDP-N-acetyl-alpha-D-muramoyl-L-alanyl-L-glutamate epimerase